jgi:hypothetical protein
MEEKIKTMFLIGEGVKDFSAIKTVKSIAFYFKETDAVPPAVVTPPVVAPPVTPQVVAPQVIEPPGFIVDFLKNNIDAVITDENNNVRKKPVGAEMDNMEYVVSFGKIINRNPDPEDYAEEDIYDIVIDGDIRFDIIIGGRFDLPKGYGGLSINLIVEKRGERLIGKDFGGDLQKKVTNIIIRLFKYSDKKKDSGYYLLPNLTKKAILRASATPFAPAGVSSVSAPATTPIIGAILPPPPSTPPVIPAAISSPPAIPAAIGTPPAIPAMPAAISSPPVMPAVIGTPPVMPAAIGSPPVIPAAIGSPPVIQAEIGTPPVMPAAIGTPPVMPATIGASADLLKNFMKDNVKLLIHENFPTGKKLNKAARRGFIKDNTIYAKAIGDDFDTKYFKVDYSITENPPAPNRIIESVMKYEINMGGPYLVSVKFAGEFILPPGYGGAEINILSPDGTVEVLDSTSTGAIYLDAFTIEIYKFDDDDSNNSGYFILPDMGTKYEMLKQPSAAIPALIGTPPVIPAAIDTPPMMLSAPSSPTAQVVSTFNAIPAVGTIISVLMGTTTPPVIPTVRSAQVSPIGSVVTSATTSATTSPQGSVQGTTQTIPQILLPAPTLAQPYMQPLPLQGPPIQPQIGPLLNINGVNVVPYEEIKRLWGQVEKIIGQDSFSGSMDFEDMMRKNPLLFRAMRNSVLNQTLTPDNYGRLSNEWAKLNSINRDPNAPSNILRRNKNYKNRIVKRYLKAS